MKLSIFKLTIFLLLATPYFLFSNPLPIAVNDLEAKGLEKSDASIISDKLRNVLFGSGKFLVLERSQMEEILKEQGFQQTGCIDQSCAVEIGQLLGVGYIVAGSIGKLGKTYLMSIRLIDVSTGKIVISEDMDCKCSIEDVLNDLTVNVANKVIKSAEKINSPVASPKKNYPFTLNSNPQKATVYLNNEKKGITPFELPSITEGSYELKLKLKGYKPLSEKILIKDGTFEKEYTLKKAKKRIISKIGLGILVAGSGVLGIIANNKSKSHISTGNDIKSSYIASASNDDFTSYETKYNNEINEAQKYSLIRNISYGVCVASAIGFTINIAIK